MEASFKLTIITERSQSPMNLKIFTKHQALLKSFLFFVLLIIWSHNCRETNSEKTEQDPDSWRFRVPAEILYPKFKEKITSHKFYTLFEGCHCNCSKNSLSCVVHLASLLSKVIKSTLFVLRHKPISSNSTSNNLL